MHRVFDLPIQAPQQNLEPMQVDGVSSDDQDINEELIVVNNPTLDLETYALQYKGTARLQRLIFIANRSPTLRTEALTMALDHVKDTMNVPKYREIAFKLLRNRRFELNDENHPDNDDCVLSLADQAWLNSRSKMISLKTEKLDLDLKNYRANSIKESIRRGTDDLGEHHLDCGDLNNALRCFVRAREYCTSGKHVVECCMNIIRVSVYLQYWQHVDNHVLKALNTPEVVEALGSSSLQANFPPDTISQNTINKLRCCMGLADLAARRYKKAAQSFLKTTICSCDFMDIMSARDIAVYTGLCALATFDRAELAKDIIQKISFKQFLELDPPLREIIQHFYESRYGQCLALLDSIKDNLLLDIYLAPHVNTLYNQIRKRAWIQYFSPYLSADMSRMATAFNTTVPQVEEEIMQLILDNQIQARIDSHNKIIYAKDVDQRTTTFQKCIKMGEEFEKRTRALLLRAALIRHEVVVRSPQRGDTTLVTNGDGEQATSFSQFNERVPS